MSNNLVLPEGLLDSGALGGVLVGNTSAPVVVNVGLSLERLAPLGFHQLDEKVLNVIN